METTDPVTAPGVQAGHPGPASGPFFLIFLYANGVPEAMDRDRDRFGDRQPERPL